VPNVNQSVIFVAQEIRTHGSALVQPFGLLAYTILPELDEHEGILTAATREGLASTGSHSMVLRILFIVFAVNLAAISNASALDPRLPAYETTTGISGQIKSVGSDTLDNEMLLWAKAFMALYPDVKVEVEGKGSATAPPALLAGVSQLGPMSRPMSAEEADAFEKQYGYKVTGFRVAVDALAVYVNKDNPIECLSMQQVNRIFSSTRTSSFGGDIKTWGDAGLSGEWSTKPISLYGRNSISGTYEFFREMALYSGTYKAEVKQQPGSEAVVQRVAGDRFGIGYSGIGYKTEGVRTVALALHEGARCYETSAEATYSRNYPFARYLYIYLNKNPNRPLDKLVSEFIKFVVSKDGQMQAEIGGFYSISNDDREVDLKKLGIATIAK
jgi:phosphate transport system substrate-binding protein